MYRRIIKSMVIFIPLIIWGCSEDRGTNSEGPHSITRSSSIQAKYTYIRSQIGGGGVFLIGMTPVSSRAEKIELKIKADPCLHAHLDRTTLDHSFPAAEITVTPDNTSEFRVYQIEVYASCAKLISPLILEVEVMQWPCGNPDEAYVKMSRFIEWIKKEYPQVGDVSSEKWNAFLTYPQIWVVNHWTFLSDEWEIRLCYHVMIPPYDWSYFRLRKRGEFEPMLAAKRDSESQPLHKIYVEDYPIMYGY